MRLGGSSCPVSLLLRLCAVVALAAPAIASAQSQWGFSNSDPRTAKDTGAGSAREPRTSAAATGMTSSTSRTIATASADTDRRYGSRDRYRDLFRRGFQEGYRFGYGAYGYQSGAPGRSGAPSWSGGRGTGRYDLAYQTGLNDGYEAGLNDARDRRRFDPISEGRYRDGDRGYERVLRGPRGVQEQLPRRLQRRVQARIPGRGPLHRAGRAGSGRSEPVRRVRARAVLSPSRRANEAGTSK